PLIVLAIFAGGPLDGKDRQAADYFRQGLEAVRRGALDEAQRQIESGLKLDPNSPAGFDLLGIVYGRVGRFDQARQAFQKALTIQPNFLPARNDLGSALYQHGLVKAATEQFTEALRIEPGNFTANYNLGLILFETKNYRRAARYLALARQ